MKKFIYGISAAVICTLLSVQLAHSINNDKFDVFLSSNVEALARSEGDISFGPMCSKTGTFGTHYMLLCSKCRWGFDYYAMDVVGFCSSY